MPATRDPESDPAHSGSVPPDIERLIQRVGGGDPLVALARLRAENSEYRKRHHHDQEIAGELQRRLGGASGDVDANVGALVRENRELQRRITELEAALPPEGATVLAG